MLLGHWNVGPQAMGSLARGSLAHVVIGSRPVLDTRVIGSRAKAKGTLALVGSQVASPAANNENDVNINATVNIRLNTQSRTAYNIIE